MARSDNDQRREEEFRWIDAESLTRLVGFTDAILIVEAAMRAVSQGGVTAPQRWAMPVGDVGRMGLMPGAMPSIERFGVKVLSLYDAAARGDRPSHQGVMLLFDLRDGRPLCAIDAAALTTLRTAAATAVATLALARPESSALAIVGCGEQARPHLAAIRAVLPITRVFLWNRTRTKAEALACQCAEDVDITVCASPAEAVRDADVVCTLTAASTPLLRGDDLSPGQHINLVGSSVSGPREVDNEIVRRSRFFVDSRDHALSQAAELRSAIAAGILDESHIMGEIGDVLRGDVLGRCHADDITLYKSLGHVAQDLAIANAAFASLETATVYL